MLQKIIPDQKSQLIRDAIGRVLAAEFDNQGQIIEAYNAENNTNLEIITPNIFVNRENTLDINELPAINIIMPEINYTEEKTSFTTQADLKYFIEVYTYAVTNEFESGDVLSSNQLDKIVGMIRAILMSQEYRFLDFVDKFIYDRSIASYQRTRPRIAADANNVISGVIEIHYKAEETTELYEGVLETFLSTVVKLELTNKGYKFIIQ